MNHKNKNQSQLLKWIDWFIEWNISALSKYFHRCILEINKEKLDFIKPYSYP